MRVGSVILPDAGRKGAIWSIVLAGALSLARARARDYVSRMFWRFARILTALIVTLGLALPAGAHAMPAMGTAAGHVQICASCPSSSKSGTSNPDKMPTCPMSACIGVVVAVMPTHAQAAPPISAPVSRVGAAVTRLESVMPVPDPFPPRSPIPL